MVFSIGIDIGTENSAAAVTQINNGKLIQITLPSIDGLSIYGKSFPSYVMINNDKIYVGKKAKDLKLLYSDYVFSHFKRKMGTDYLYKVYNKYYTPQELTAFLLKKIKEDSELYMDDRIKEAVITVPAYFNDNQRNATKTAAEIAGIKVKRLINEPTAAAIAFGFKKLLNNENYDNKNILVYDIGAGTVDVTIINLNKRSFNVLSTSGDISTGGIEMDNAVKLYISNFLKNNNINIKNVEKYDSYIDSIAENIKIRLSTYDSYEVYLNDLLGKFYEYNDKIIFKITRNDFENLIKNIVNKTIKSIDNALEKSSLTKKDINELILTGGPTRIPYVRKAIENYLNLKSMNGIDPMEIVARGASIIAADKNSINESISGPIKFNDVTPLTLGNVIINDVVIPMIPANTKVPCNVTRPFTTIKDYQKEIEIKIVQGERPMGSDNSLLGNFILQNIKPLPRGKVRIDVTYKVDRNGILHVSAIDAITGSKKEIVIKDSINIDKNKIKKMKEDLKKYYIIDNEKKKMALIMNSASDLLYRLKELANSQYNSDIKYYNINNDILKLAKNIKDNDINNLEKLLKEIKNEYNI